MYEASPIGVRKNGISIIETQPYYLGYYHGK